MASTEEGDHITMEKQFNLKERAAVSPANGHYQSPAPAPLPPTNGRYAPVLEAAPAMNDLHPSVANPIIQALEVVKVFDTGKVRVPALRGVSFAVGRGEMVAIMGPSGSGKTTLLNCLAGLEAIDQGQIIIDGTDIATMNDRAKTDYRARNMGFVFQFYNLLPVLSAVENVELPLVVSGVNTKEARERAMRALDLVRLREWAGHKPAELSGGQRQRVTIARALVNEPAIVWADEPTGDLDSETADEIMHLMQDLNARQGQTFVLVTHDGGIGARCGRIIKMRDGQIIDDGLGHIADSRAFVGDGQARPIAGSGQQAAGSRQ
jgi:putative ABC transport system ATP-binding protein